MELLTRCPSGLRSAEIAERLDLGLKHVTRVLIVMRNREQVWSELLEGSTRTHRWLLRPPEQRQPQTGERPIPNFDEEHREWVRRVTQPKFSCNPWGRV